MNKKIVIVLLMLVACCVLNAKEEEAITWEKLNHALVESRNPVDRPPSKYYALCASKACTPGPGVVVIKRMDGEGIEVPVFIDKEGRVRDPNEINAAVIGMDGGYAEEFEVLLLAIENEKDLKPIAKCVIIPFPRIVQDRRGHKIELRAITADGEHFFINGSGFEANEKISFQSRSCDEHGASSIQADEQGNFVLTLHPAVVGKTEGSFEVIFMSEKMKLLHMKPLTMKHYWGKIAFTNPNKYKTLGNR